MFKRRRCRRCKHRCLFNLIVAEIRFCFILAIITYLAPAAGAELVPLHALSADAVSLAENVLKSGYWGCFRITALDAHTKNGGEYGAFETRCYFHKLNAGTGCAKYIRIEGCTWAHRYERCSDGPLNK